MKSTVEVAKMKVVNGNVVLESGEDICLGRPFKARGGRVWAKLLEGVDESKQGGYAFEGPFLKTTIDPAWIVDEVPVGSLIVCKEAAGSTRHPWSEIAVYKVSADGIEELYRHSYNNKSDRILAVHEIAELVKKEQGKEDDSELARAVEELFNRFGKEKVIEYIKKVYNQKLPKDLYSS